MIHTQQEEQNYIEEEAGKEHFIFLLAVGSKGSTLDQLLLFLGSRSVEELNCLASKIVSSVLLQRKDGDGGPVVSFVNGVWIDQRFHLKPSFEEVAKGVYGAITKEVDFVTKATEVIEEVNYWAETATKGLIKHLLPKEESLGNDTCLVLANALYFKGSWDRKFDPSRTEFKHFHLLDGQIVQAPFMTTMSYERNLYGTFDGYKVVKLPYQNGPHNLRFSMYFFLPDATDGFECLVEKTDPTVWNCDSSLVEEDVKYLWIPRFRFSFELEASSTMKELGLELPFMDVGEFTDMMDTDRSPVLSKVFHKSFIEVNEEGTEAAASTAPGLILCCARIDPPRFVADHPFIFTIKEENSGLVFFIGSVLNPILVS
ncbi:hypothetical protein K2173_020075 [Erythroxylum novogranatense]|uniref:Serpin domain-containing protein n=1 Tax=Erythroxylum novogranatense TaxID=1862640 RepID=A0AAV8U6Z7_9ROSI|nr:hypothetical protein K2173_020075 [Erythroxylum novogranatense]